MKFEQYMFTSKIIKVELSGGDNLRHPKPKPKPISLLFITLCVSANGQICSMYTINYVNNGCLYLHLFTIQDTYSTTQHNKNW